MLRLGSKISHGSPPSAEHRQTPSLSLLRLCNHRLCGLNNRGLLLWKLEVQDQDVSSFGFSEAVRENPFQASLPAPGGLLVNFVVLWF